MANAKDQFIPNTDGQPDEERSSSGRDKKLLTKLYHHGKLMKLREVESCLLRHNYSISKPGGSVRHVYKDGKRNLTYHPKHGVRTDSKYFPKGKSKQLQLMLAPLYEQVFGRKPPAL